eukprot:scaffold15475_cov59-Cylindrotheca_fusiformis.AAC.2
MAGVPVYITLLGLKISQNLSHLNVIFECYCFPHAPHETKHQKPSMTVPYLLNPYRSRRASLDNNAIKLSQSTYHQEPENYYSYHHVGRRTKGGGGGYVHGGSSAAAAASNNNNNADGALSDGEGMAIVAGLWTIIALILCCQFCRKHCREGRRQAEMERAFHLARQRQEMNNSSNVNYTIPTAATSSLEGGGVPSTSNYYYDSNMPSRQDKMHKNFKFHTVLPGEDERNMNNGDSTTDNDEESYRSLILHLPITGGGDKEDTITITNKNKESSEGYEIGQTICASGTTQCNHVFHQGCLEEWLKDHDNCPMCRVNLMYSPPSYRYKTTKLLHPCDWFTYDCDEDGRVTRLQSWGRKMHGTLPTEIGNLQQLSDIVLPDVQFSGPIPSEIGNPPQLTKLDFLRNNFSGAIPSEIGNLQQLKVLHLYGNIGLNCTVPVEVGQLESLTEADFAFTSLTGGLDDESVFCKNTHHHYHLILRADCGGLNPKIICECCDQCCSDSV